jgi:F-type H+-transporting ATPase subunit b
MFFMTLLAAGAEEQPPPMIDLDLTVVIQFAFFLLMLFVLSRFLFKPYLKMRDDRKHGIEGARKSAHDMEASANKMVADYDAAFSRAKQRGAEERQKVRAEAAAHERQVLGAAREEAQRALGAARTKIGGEAAEAKKQLDTQAASMGRTVASRILGREVA